jgi:uncharacterized membrane protein
MSEEPHESLDERLLHRMLFFTDAVFAIVLTLLVLELRPPEAGPGGLSHAMQEIQAHLAVFAGSFALIAMYWLVHVNITRRLARFDWPSAIVNLVFLFPVCLIPFASAWLGSAISSSTSWTFYCSVLIGTSLASAVLVLVSSRDAARLIAGGMTREERVYRLFRALIPGVAFTVGLVALQLGIYAITYYCWLLIPVLFALVRFIKPKDLPATPARAKLH